MSGQTEYHRVHLAMEKAVAEQIFPGAVLVWGTPDRIMFHGAYGQADLTTGEPVSLETVFDLASLTKPLATTLAAAELIREKKMDTDTALGQILPGAEGTDKADITIDMLLRHTSGLPAHRAYFKMLGRSCPWPVDGARAAIRQRVLDEPLDHLPGRQEVYSDLGFILLAWALETISGMRLDRLVRETVFNPLGIDGLYFPGGEPERAGGRAVAATSRCPWRGRLVKGEVEDENAWAAGGVEGHAGLFGDGESVFRLGSSVLSAAMGRPVRVPDAEVIKIFFKKRPCMGRVAGFDTPAKENSSAGRHFSDRAVGHLGFTGTSIWMDPADGLMVVLLTNRVHPSRENVRIRQFRPFIHDLIHQAAANQKGRK
ncbi:MAG: beta-lactamase family protein [Desulfobacter sp.]|nr:MAG: beta-lactamase family protein [Desulfobacter sp.]